MTAVRMKTTLFAIDQSLEVWSLEVWSLEVWSLEVWALELCAFFGRKCDWMGVWSYKLTTCKL